MIKSAIKTKLATHKNGQINKTRLTFFVFILLQHTLCVVSALHCTEPLMAAFCFSYDPFRAPRWWRPPTNDIHRRKTWTRKKHFVLLAVTPPGRWIFYCRPHLSECERLSFARGTLLKMCGRRAFCPANANIHNSWQKTRCRPGKFSCCCCFCRVFFPDVVVVVVLLSAAIGRPQCIGVLPFCTLEIRGWSNYYFFSSHMSFIFRCGCRSTNTTHNEKEQKCDETQKLNRKKINKFNITFCALTSIQQRWCIICDLWAAERTIKYFLNWFLIFSLKYCLNSHIFAILWLFDLLANFGEISCIRQRLA